MEEVWKKIKNYHYYKISNYGRIISYRYKKPRFLKIQKCNNGYERVVLYNNSGNKRFLVHRLVLETFKSKSKLEVNHIDCNRSNNRLDNLEYCTRLHNIRHKYKNSNNHNLQKFTESQVVEIRNLRKRKSLKYISEKFGVSIACISLICSKKRYEWVE